MSATKALTSSRLLKSTFELDVITEAGLCERRFCLASAVAGMAMATHKAASAAAPRGEGFKILEVAG